MRSRRLNEQSAYELMCQTAMSQNRRLIEVAEDIVGMADLFRS
jgi:AmiR/NasT family two-component response regulator